MATKRKKSGIATIMLMPLIVSTLFVVGSVAIIVSTIQTVYNAAACSVGFATLPLKFTIDTIDSLIDSSGHKFSLTREQADNAALIVGIGEARGEGVQRETVLIDAALVESGLKNLPYGDRDSVNFWQMRPSALKGDGTPYWGTYQQLMDPIYSTNRMYDELDRKVPDLSIMSVGQAAQAIEVSGHPERYQPQADRAAAIVKAAVPVTGHSVAFIGDSIGYGMAQTGKLEDQLKTASWTEVKIDAVVGRHIAGQTGAAPTSGIDAIQTIQASGQKPDAWIIELGTNDVASLGSSQAAQQLIGQLLDKIDPSTPVMWVNTYLPAMTDQSKQFNDALQEATKQHSNLKIADWASYLSDNHDLMAGDNVHLSSAGYGQMAYFVAQTSVGLRPSPVNPTSSGHSSFIGNTCKTGKKILDTALAFIEAQEGWPFKLAGIVGIGKSVSHAPGLFQQAFANAGFDLPDISGPLPSGLTVIDYSSAERGDLVFWPADSSGPARRGIYLGHNQVIIEPQPGEVVTASPMNWMTVSTVIRLDIPDQPSTTATTWQNPLQDSYTISSGFGYRIHPIRGTVEMHDGIDMSAADGVLVHAPANGTITRLAYSGVDGAMVYIDHGNGVTTYYFDMASFNRALKVGDQIAAGDVIGTIGNCHCSGSTGAHVHLRVHVNDQPTDPVHFFQERGINL